MIVLPTEKRLDWSRAPIVLIIIVFLNIAVFFLYQTQDTQKSIEVMDLYTSSEKDYFNNERRDYFEFYNITYSTAYESVDEIDPFEILMDDDFYSHIKTDYYKKMNQWDYDNYFHERDQIQDIVNSVSSLAHGFIPNQIELSRVFTHMFLHGGLMHLMGNLFFLVLCGFAVEAAIGHLRFLLFYLISGIGSVFTFAVTDLSSSTPLIGASGAISGVMAMYLVVFRLKKIEFFYWFYFFVGYFKAPALLILPIYIGNEVYQYMTLEGSNVAYMAHLGGFVTGAISLGVLHFFFPKTIDNEYIIEDDVEDGRLEKLGTIYTRIESYRFKEAGRLIQKYQLEFEDDDKLKLLNYHMLGLQQSDEAKEGRKQLAMTLLSQSKIENKNLASLANIWAQNTQIKYDMDTDKLRRLAWRLCDFQDLKHAEQITVHLARTKRDDSMIALLQKLAKEFAEQNNQPKRIQYLKLAQSISSQGA